VIRRTTKRGGESGSCAGDKKKPCNGILVPSGLSSKGKVFSSAVSCFGVDKAGNIRAVGEEKPKNVGSSAISGGVFPVHDGREGTNRGET